MTDVAVTCPECMGTLKCPIQLPCFHAYCRTCLKDTRREDGSLFIRCSLCDLEFPDMSMDDVQADDFLFKYMESVNDAVLAMSETCKNCLEKSTHVCLDCKLCFCQNCKDKHVLSDRKHELSEFNNALENMFKRKRKILYSCKKHDEDLIFFCMTCSNLTCMQCSIEEHKRHWCVSIAEAIKLKSDEIKQIFDRLKCCVKTSICELETLPKFYTSGIEKVKKETSDFFQSLTNILSHKLSELTHNISAFEKVVATENATFLKTLSRTHSKVSAALDRLLLVNRYGSASDMLLHYRNIKTSRLMEEIRSLEDATSLSQLRLITDSTAEDITMVLNRIHISQSKLTGNRKNVALKSFLDE